MAKKLKDVLIEAAEKAGIPRDNKSIQHIASLTELDTLEFPDDILKPFEENLYSELSAKSKLAPKWKKEVYDGVDAELDEIIKEYALNDETSSRIKSIQGTGKRAKEITKTIADLERAKKAADPKDKTDIQNEINGLKEKLAKSNEDKESAIASLNIAHGHELTQMGLMQLLTEYKLNFADGVPMEIQTQAGLSSFNKFLNEKGAKVIRENNGQLKLVDKNNTDFVDESHKKVDVKSAMDLSLSRDNLLKKTEAVKPDSPNLIIDGGGANKNQNLDAVNSIREQLKGITIPS